MEKLKKILETIVPALCAVLVVISFLSLIYILIFHAKEIPDSIKSVLMVFAGALCSTFVMLFNYWFGSSSGSKAKTELMDKAESAISNLTDQK